MRRRPAGTRDPGRTLSIQQVKVIPQQAEVAQGVPGRLTLNLLTTTIVAPPSNASKWQMGFNSAFKGLRPPEFNRHMRVVGCQPYAPAAFTPRIILVLIFRG